MYSKISNADGEKYKDYTVIFFIKYIQGHERYRAYLYAYLSHSYLSKPKQSLFS